MKIEKIGSRGTAFTFEEQESALGEYTVYLINSDNRVYLCDTHLGPKSMEPIKEYLQAQGLNKPLVIFLSHSDWDHVWGVCAFANPLVAAHELCAQKIIQRGPLELQRYASYQNGDIRLVTPNLTFDSRLLFADDGVEFIYAPGHTVDSAICFDHRDLVLYAGDLVEKPQPSIGWHDLENYIDTLEYLGELPAQVIITSHSGIVTREDIDDNLDYIRECQEIVEKGPDEDDDDADYIRKLYTLLLYEDAIAQTIGGDFDYAAFQRQLWQSLEMDYLSSETALLRNADYEELKLALESYMAGL
ncbi:MAG: MBL fold metallo-hydrolase [Eubacteriales bacterium]|nr:MBL fold metallo-hydrolase [Eubacteriales bacterium]